MINKDKQKKDFEKYFLNDQNEIGVKYFIKARNPLTEDRIMREAHNNEIEESEKVIKAVLIESNTGYVVTTEKDQPLLAKEGLVVTDKNGSFEFYIQNKDSIMKTDISKSLKQGNICIEEVEDKDVGLMFKKFQESLEERTIVPKDEQSSN